MSSTNPGSHRRKPAVLAAIVIFPLLGAIPAWAGRAPGGATLSVHNARASDLEFHIDGRTVAIVRAGRKQILRRIKPGLRSLVALSGGTPVDARMVLLAERSHYRWEVLAQGGGVRVTNGRPEPLNVTVDGRSKGIILPGEELVVTNLRIGTRSVAALSVGGVLRGRLLLKIHSGTERRWVVR